jgi:phosphate/sulfate permease
MMDSESVMQRAEDALRRHSAEPRLAKRLRARRRQSFFAKIKRIIGVGLALALGLALWGLIVGPVGTSGAMLAVLAFIVAMVALMIFPRASFSAAEPEPTTELALLPLQTEEWLASQRKMLPAPAIKIVDGIGLTLEQLAPQLQRIDEKEPLAAEARRLIADDLPELVKSYAQVPPAMRKTGLNGISPDQQLADGLSVVSSQLSRLTEQLAQGDVNKLATQGRYLELKYQGEA